MRITGGRLIDLQSAATTANQSKVGQLAREVSSGLRVATPSDDPTAWLAAHRASARRMLSEGTGIAMQFARDQLAETDGALSTIHDALSTARLLAVQGGTDGVNAAARSDLAVQVRALFDTARAAANMRSATGDYLFAGSLSTTMPFDATGAYVGDATTRAVPTTEAATTIVTVTGSELTAAHGVDVIPLFNQLAAALEANDPAAVRGLLGGLDTALQQVSLARGRGGAAMAVIDDAATAPAQPEDNPTGQIRRHDETETGSPCPGSCGGSTGPLGSFGGPGSLVAWART